MAPSPIDEYADGIARDIEAKSESWFAQQGRGIAEGFATVGRDAWRDIGNSYQAILTQDTGWQAQWNARGMQHDYIGLSEEIGAREEALDIDQTKGVGLDPDTGPDQGPNSGPEPESPA